VDAGIVFRIRHYWEIRKVVNKHKSAAPTDSPEAALVRRALAEVCAVQVLLVFCLRTAHAQTLDSGIS